MQGPVYGTCLDRLLHSRQPNRAQHGRQPNLARRRGTPRIPLGLRLLPPRCARHVHHAAPHNDHTGAAFACRVSYHLLPNARVQPALAGGLRGRRPAGAATATARLLTCPVTRSARREMPCGRWRSSWCTGAREHLSLNRAGQRRGTRIRPRDTAAATISREVVVRRPQPPQPPHGAPRRKAPALRLAGRCCCGET